MTPTRAAALSPTTTLHHDHGPLDMDVVATITDQYVVLEGNAGVPEFYAPGQWSIVNRLYTTPIAMPEFVGSVSAASARFSAFNSNLSAALDLITTEKIGAHVNYLADDKLRGRDTPSEGLNMALDRAIAEAQKHGFTPAGVNGTYRYPWTGRGWGVFETDDLPNPSPSAPTRRSVFDTPDASNLRIPTAKKSCTKLTFKDATGTHSFQYGQDYFYSSLGNTTDRDIEISGDIALAGEGSATDFKNVDVKGKWVLVFDSPEVSPAERRDLALANGAKGLVIVPNPDMIYPELDARRVRLAKLARENKLVYPEDAALDEITVTREGAERLTTLLLSNLKPEAKKSSPVGPTALSLTDKRVLKSPFAQIKADNVVALREGSDPALKNEIVLVTAHIDHVGMQGGQIHNGADDNGSGSAALMVLLEALAKLNPGRSIMIMWVSGEEKGLLGSGAWAQNPTIPAGHKIVANINLDMIGRNAPDELYVTPSQKHPKYNDLVKIAESLSNQEGYPKLGNADNVYSRSDHYNFAKYLKIPIIFLTTGLHDDYHEPTDDAHKIDLDKIRRVSRLVVKLIDEMDRKFQPKIRIEAAQDSNPGI